MIHKYIHTKEIQEHMDFIISYDIIYMYKVKRTSNEMTQCKHNLKNLYKTTKILDYTKLKAFALRK